MLISDSRDVLAVVHERGRHFREEAVAERLRRAARPRSPLAELLRRIADRVDPPAGVPRPVAR